MDRTFDGAALLARRIAARLSRPQVAARLGCCESELFQLETGRLSGNWIWREQIEHAIDDLVREREEAQCSTASR